MEHFSSWWGKDHGALDDEAHGDGHGTGGWEWAGAFLLDPAASYTWMACKSNAWGHSGEGGALTGRLFSLRAQRSRSVAKNGGRHKQLCLAAPTRASR